ncbi:UNVERIFIED_CONTAM: hypothetical protein Sradi_6864100 [Sesamum radiatum]|uniref:Uncharacterized protein n=1 Tax=Sesamum radiatum TaxID=300843 RepID=A0AAW2JK91_SESRA
MKKLIKNLGLPIEKIDACRNGCMLYWKDDVGLEYCKFCGDTRYKPSLERDPHRKKSPYAVLRYLPLTPHLERLYSSRVTANHMTWHATHQREEGAMCHLSDAEAYKHFNRMYLDFAQEPLMFGGPLRSGVSCGGASSSQISYWWDCDDESRFKIVKSQAEKFLQKRFADARIQLARLLWLTEDIWRQLLEFWVSPEFQTKSAKNKVNRLANTEATTAVYRGGSSSIGAHKRKLTQLGHPVNQMEVFEKVYKKKTMAGGAVRGQRRSRFGLARSYSVPASS